MKTTKTMMAALAALSVLASGCTTTENPEVTALKKSNADFMARVDRHIAVLHGAPLTPEEQAEKDRFDSLTEEQRWAEIDKLQHDGDWQHYRNEMDEAVTRAIRTNSEPIWPDPPND